MNRFRKLAACITAATIITAGGIGFIPYNLVEIPALTASAAEIVASGECGAEGDNVKWEFDSEGTLTISGEGAMDNWQLQQPWQNNIFDIITVEIANGVTSIGDFSFNNCRNMTSVSIPDSITSIGESAFFDCRGLTSITIPDSVITLDNSVFYNCTNLTTVLLPNSVESFGFGAFQNCTNLTTITIENPECEIYDYVATITNGYDDEAMPYFNGTIYGYAGSTAQSYAEKYNRKFVTLDDTDEPADTLGDINNDGSVDASDASLVLAEYAKVQTGGNPTFTEKQTNAADVNSDDVIDASDASKILAYYAAVSTGKKPTWD